jgi:simple sugar transport system ATP-binding protein
MNALEAIGVSKRFGTVLALDDVSLTVRNGTIHALLGENGAGKSTLMKCLMGYYRADAGQFVVHGREHDAHNPREAQQAGIGMVYQHFTLMPSMTVAENLLLATTAIPFLIDWTRERAKLAAMLDRMPFRVPLDAQVSALSAGEKQKVEILKQLSLGHRLLILDEPTSVLTPQEADEVLGLLHDMAHEGRVTVVMITHKFREVLRFADQVSVLRHGRLVGGGAVADLTAAALAEQMIGAQPANPTVARDKPAVRGCRLEIDGLTVTGDQGAPAVRDLGLTVEGGTILGVAGVSGNGQRELVETLAGQRAPESGAIRVHGDPFRPTRAAMARLGVACLPDEPAHNACVAAMSTMENLALRRYDRPPLSGRRGFWLKPGAMRRHAEEAIRRYGIKTGGLAAPVTSLSGGNVQRLVLARELESDVGLLIASNPCFGLDFAAVAQIHDQILRVRNAGAAVLLVTEDLDELMLLADRIVVMFEGRIIFETAGPGASRAAIGRAMAGAVAETV